MHLTLTRTFVAAILILTIATLTGCNQGDADKRASEKVKRQQQVAELKRQRDARREEECQIIREAVASINAGGSNDPKEVVLACTKFRSSECNYKVEIMFKLTKLGKNDAFEKIAKVGHDCTEEFVFASKYGLEAYQEHATILQAAIDDAFERGSEDGRENCDVSDMAPDETGDEYYGRGRGRR